MSKRFFILLLMFIYITIAIPNYALSLDRDQNDGIKNLKPDIYKKAIRLVAIVVMQDENNKDLSFGSGFFANDNSIATNLHVVRGVGVKKGYIKVQDKKFNIVGVKIDEDNDLALISVDKVKARSLIIADSGKAKIGDDVYTIGSPFDLALEGTFSQGIISGIRDKGLDDHKGPLLQITAPVSSGCSGGPLLNNAGEVIGIVVSSWREGQNINFAIPSSCLDLLLKSSKPFVPLSEIKMPEKIITEKRSNIPEATNQYELGLGYIRSELYQDGLKVLNQVAYLYPNSDIADDALYRLALIREQAGDTKLALGGTMSLETVRNELNGLTGNNTTYGITRNALTFANALLQGQIVLNVAKTQAITQYLGALTYISTLLLKYPDSDKQVETLLATERIVKKINELTLSKEQLREKQKEETYNPVDRRGCIVGIGFIVAATCFILFLQLAHG